MRNIIHGGGGNDFIPNRMTTSASFGGGGGQRGGGVSNEQPFLSGHSTNQSVAFGSTQPRNIDLTRPLVTPLLLPVRPKSEIFPSSTTVPLPFELSSTKTTSSGGQIIKTQTDSSPSTKDDNNYRSKRVIATVQQQQQAIVDNMTPQCFDSSLQRQQQQQQVAATTMIEPVIIAKQQQPLQAPLFSTSSSSLLSPSLLTSSSSSFMRATRRHDPELIPAKQKYLFREYGAPSSGPGGSSGTSWNGFRKENSIMTCSMTSTKSFQSKHPTTMMSGNNGGVGGLAGRPKKSYSMNRLDQLAQPRKRVQPKGKLKIVENLFKFLNSKI